MAEHLASIFGTEKDRVNCPFYFKIGACRHGDRCSRLHNKPTISPTLLFPNMYQRLDLSTPGVPATQPPLDPRQIQEHFENFYEDVCQELSRYGELESLHVCDNTGDHMVGNVYAQYREEEHAALALQSLAGRFYAGRLIIAEFSPVTDFREATCRQYEENTCNRKGDCNFIHMKKTSRELRRRLFGRRRKHSRSRSRSPSSTRHHDGYRPRDDMGGRTRHDDDYHDRERLRGDGGRTRHHNDSYGRGDAGRMKHHDSCYHGDGGRDDGRQENRRNRQEREYDERPHRTSRVRESSAERRAKIEEWNRQRESDQVLQPPTYANYSNNGGDQGLQPPVYANYNNGHDQGLQPPAYAGYVNGHDQGLQPPTHPDYSYGHGQHSAYANHGNGAYSK